MYYSIRTQFSERKFTYAENQTAVYNKSFRHTAVRAAADGRSARLTVVCCSSSFGAAFIFHYQKISSIKSTSYSSCLLSFIINGIYRSRNGKREGEAADRLEQRNIGSSHKNKPRCRRKYQLCGAVALYGR